MTRSLRFRFAAASVAIVGLVLAVCGASVVLLYQRQARADFDQRLRRQARAVSVPVIVNPDVVGDLPSWVPAAIGLSGSVAVWRDGAPLARLGSVPAVVGRAPTEGSVTEAVEGTDWRFTTVATTVGDSEVLVQVGAPLTEVERSTASVRTLVVTLGAAGVMATIGAGWLVSGRLERPLTRLQQAAVGITSTDQLHQRLPVEDPTEVRDLARAMNAMLERLDDSAAETAAALESARSFAAHVAHELRTPLASLRVNLDALLSEQSLSTADRAAAIDAVSGEQARLVALLDGLRLLALSGQPSQLVASMIDLGEVVDRRVEAARRRHPADRIDVRFEPGSFELPAWEQGVEAAVDNLVNNALVHGRVGGRPVLVEVTVAHDAAGFVVLVDDDGPGVPPSARSAVFDRFARLSSEPGSGLGLALVDQLARIHRGSATILESPRGGARVSLRLVGLEARSPLAR